MKRLIVILTLLTIGALSLTACASSSATPPQGQEVNTEGGSYRDITSAQLKAMLDKKDFFFVNVHIPYDGEIAKTDLFLPYDQVETNLSKLPADKGAKIVLYCRSGSMSATAAKTLVGLGYTNVSNLDGGMIDWEKQGYERIRKPQ